jgi:hypothetical protein
MTRKQPSKTKVQANQENSRKSTGPKTDQGKAVAKRNALQHGILSNQLVVLPEHESADQYLQLQANLTDYFKPLGSLEEMCVELIASLYWRLRRVIAFEHGSILANLAVVDIQSKFDREQNWIEAADDTFSYGTTSDKRKALNTTSHGLNVLLQTIVQFVETLKQDGEIEKITIKDLEGLLGRYHFDKGRAIVNMTRAYANNDRQWLADHYRQNLIDEGEIDKGCQDIDLMSRLGLIRAWEYIGSVVEDRLEEVTRADEISDQAAKLVASLPDPDDVQKIWSIWGSNPVPSISGRIRDIYRMSSSGKTSGSGWPM